MSDSSPGPIVLDASVLFDFNEVGYLGQMLRLSRVFYATNYIEGEIKSVNTHMLRAFGVKIGTLSSTQNAELFKICAEFRRSISVPDASAYVYARDNGFALATRDSGLWQVADLAGLQIYETHDLLLMMIEESLLTSNEAADILTKMNERQPVKLQKWIDIIKQLRKR